jgi:hypothetical protein
MKKKEKGISKILATMILISICLINTVATVNWVSGISEKYMNIKKIEIMDYWNMANWNQTTTHSTLVSGSSVSKSISSYGSVRYPEHQLFYGIWTDWTWTWRPLLAGGKTREELNSLFDTLIAHRIQYIFCYVPGFDRNGDFPEFYGNSFYLVSAMNDYNEAHGTTLEAHVWINNHYDYRSNPADLNDPAVQSKIIETIRKYTDPTYGLIPEGGAPFTGVNLDFEFYTGGRELEVVSMTNLVAATFPDLTVSTDISYPYLGHNPPFGKEFSKDVDYIIVMMYDTQLERDAYAEWFRKMAKTQLLNTDKPLLLAVPAGHNTGEDISFALQGLQALLSNETFTHLDGLALFDVKHMTLNRWSYWDLAVALVDDR